MGISFKTIFLCTLIFNSLGHSEAQSVRKSGSDEKKVVAGGKVISLKKVDHNPELGYTRPPNERISEKYREGTYLIYDCVGKFWACVNGKSFRKCQRERRVAYIERKFNLVCAPFVKFKVESECFKTQMAQIIRRKSEEFCFP